MMFEAVCSTLVSCICACLQDEDGSDEDSSAEASVEESADGSEEPPQSSASFSESGDGHCSEAAEDDSEDVASSETSEASLSSSEEKPAKKQKTEKPEKKNPKTEKPDKCENNNEKPQKETKTKKVDSHKKTEKPEKETKTEKPGRPSALSSHHKDKKEKKEKKDKKVTVNERAIVAVEKLKPSAAAAIGKAMVCAGQTTEQGAADFSAANSSPLIKPCLLSCD